MSEEMTTTPDIEALLAALPSIRNRTERDVGRPIAHDLIHADPVVGHRSVLRVA